MESVRFSEPFSAVLEAARGIQAPVALEKLRAEGRKSFADLGIPSRRLEDWRFTRLATLEQSSFESPVRTAPEVNITPWILEGSHLMVFVDGVYAPALSSLGDLPEGVVVSTIADVAEAGFGDLESLLGSLAPVHTHAFAALNTALAEDGAIIRIQEGTVAAHPIQLIFVAGAHDRPTLSAPRILISSGAASSATIVTNHIGGGGASLSCPVSEIFVEQDAVLEHVMLQEEGPSASHLAIVEARLGERSRYTASTVSLGGRLARTDIGVVLDGEHADATINGVYLTDADQQADTHITVRHAQPNCTSEQLFKGILAGKSRAVFNGRIIVDQDAQKTDARQSSRNLLLSDNALVNSNPQLEIFADDVRCTHGSTIGRLDEEAIFYLRTRGIGREEARHILTLAFAGEVLQRIPLASIRDRLEKKIEGRLGRVEFEEEIA